MKSTFCVAHQWNICYMRCDAPRPQKKFSTNSILNTVYSSPTNAYVSKDASNSKLLQPYIFHTSIKPNICMKQLYFGDHGQLHCQLSQYACIRKKRKLYLLISCCFSKCIIFEQKFEAMTGISMQESVHENSELSNIFVMSHRDNDMPLF